MSSWFDRVFPDTQPRRLGDFNATRRLIPIAFMATAIGVLSAFVAVLLLDLIGLFTNLFFYGRWSTTFVSPSGHHLGVWVVLVPVLGSLIIGLMARFGSEKIRGHGIPEALESILMRGSRVEPRLAVLKPLSAAVSIGSGGPFGAEGPIIMTGGAFGSLIAGAFHLTAAERKTLLVSGATAGMAATFGSPLAAILLGVELLLFEWKPRSFIPVALACTAAMCARRYLMAPGALFHVAPHPAFIGLPALLGCLVAGLAAGGLSALMTLSVYAFEDLFQHLKIHWMWWPAIGGVAIGIGGLIEPRALGVGYETIGHLMTDSLTLRAVIVVLLVKWGIWSFSLGSGTSGGVLAPLLMLGGGLGAILGHVLPPVVPGFYALITMGAILGGTMRAPFTGILFAVEITHDFEAMMPLTVAVAAAYGFTVLVLRRSILTEKVARRGFHVTREYAIDPLEVLFVREVMRDDAAAGEAVASAVAAPDETLRTAAYRMAKASATSLSVVDTDGNRLGVIALQDLLKARLRHLEEETRRETVHRWVPW